MIQTENVFTTNYAVYSVYDKENDDWLAIESSADKTKIKIAKSSVSRCLTVKEEEKK